MKMPTSAVAVFGLATLFALSACGSKEAQPTDVVEENITSEVPMDESAPINNAETAPAAAPVNAMNSIAPPPAFTDTEQMREDADATGLTARLPSDEAPVSGANETQPAK